jgi:hypothetical protein
MAVPEAAAHVELSAIARVPSDKVRKNIWEFCQWEDARFDKFFIKLSPRRTLSGSPGLKPADKRNQVARWYSNTQVVTAGGIYRDEIIIHDTQILQLLCRPCRYLINTPNRLELLPACALN